MEDSDRVNENNIYETKLRKDVVAALNNEATLGEESLTKFCKNLLQSLETSAEYKEEVIINNGDTIEDYFIKQLKLLLKLKYDYEEEYTGSLNKKKYIWQKISKEMKKNGYNLSPTIVFEKYNLILKKYQSAEKLQVNYSSDKHNILTFDKNTNIEVRDSQAPIRTPLLDNTGSKNDSLDLLMALDNLSSNQFENQVHGVEKPDKTMFNDNSIWNVKNTELFLKMRLEMEEKFRSKTKKSELWQEISEKLQSYGWNVSPDVIEKKFKNLRWTYLRNRERLKSGKGDSNWKYYDIMHNIIGDMDNFKSSTIEHNKPKSNLELVKSEKRQESIKNWNDYLTYDHCSIKSHCQSIENHFDLKNEDNQAAYKNKIKLLLKLRLNMNNEFLDVVCDEIQLWNKITMDMKKQGFDITVNSAEKIYNMLCKNYFQFKEGNNSAINLEHDSSKEFFQLFDDKFDPTIKLSKSLTTVFDDAGETFNLSSENVESLSKKSVIDEVCNMPQVYEKRSLMWTSKNVNLFLRIKLQIGNEIEKKSIKYYKNISDKMKTYGVFIAPKHIEKKFNNLRTTYFRIKEKHEKECSEPVWEYYKMLQKILEDEPKTNEQKFHSQKKDLSYNNYALETNNKYLVESISSNKVPEPILTYSTDLNHGEVKIATVSSTTDINKGIRMRKDKLRRAHLEELKQIETQRTKILSDIEKARTESILKIELEKMAMIRELETKKIEALIEIEKEKIAAIKDLTNAIKMCRPDA